MSDAAVQQTQGLVWDLNSYFTEFNGPAMLAFKDTLRTEIAQLQKEAAALGNLSADTADAWAGLLVRSENWGSRYYHISSYVGCLSAADAKNSAYPAEQAVLGLIGADSAKFGVDVLRAFKGVDDAVFNAFAARPELEGMGHYLARIREQAEYRMEPELEKLQADLSVDGFATWGRLYDTVSGKLEFELEVDGQKKMVPISQWRSMMSDVDREKGRKAYEAGNVAWEKVTDVCAACLNAIAGTRLTLNKRRGIPHFLEPALFQAKMSRASLDAMYKAIHDNIDVARDVFNAKAEFLGQDGICWYEKEAPLPLEDDSTYSWQKGSDMVSEAFHKVYPALGEYYDSFIEQRWMESEVRPGKRPGAFCTGSPYTGEQRVYMTFNGSLGDVTTLAHEMGHAWHGHLLKELRPFARQYPMTLAETASIFAEHILADGIYADDSISDSAKLQMLDADLNGAAVLLLDITTRYEFEKAFHEEREKGTVSVERFKQLMSATQKKVMGDAMPEGGEDPLFWASKLHFYITGVSFYNYPYTVGFLLARNLANRLHAEGSSFLPKYEAFLMMTGSATVEECVAKCLDDDATKPEFWAQSINSLKPELAKYRELLKARKA
ncbi:MAG: M3 family oligoendopeptidase [Planctomycetales bacterium]|nr:MAG: M3 family oligoendopeptidase [Planctomycetales bacterium]